MAREPRLCNGRRGRFPRLCAAVGYLHTRRFPLQGVELLLEAVLQEGNSVLKLQKALEAVRGRTSTVERPHNLSLRSLWKTGK